MKKAGSSLPHRIAGCFWPVKALNRLKGSRVQGAVLGDGGQPPQQKGGPLTRGLTASPQCPGLPQILAEYPLDGLASLPN